MFESVINRSMPPGRKKAPLQPQSLYPILTAADLLSPTLRAQSVKQLKEQIKASRIVQQDIEILYLSVLDNFAELVQLIPETQDGYFSHPGGMLDFSLQMATEALLIHRSPEILAKTSQIFAQREVLWTYAIFTAALLGGVRELTRRLVSLCDQEGRPIEMWLSYEGPMTTLKIPEVTHYRYSFSQAYWPTIYRQGVVPLVIEHILPDNAIQWLASDPWVFNYWLAVLGQEAGAGTLGNVISLARDQALAKEKALLQQEEERLAHVSQQKENAASNLSDSSNKENKKFSDQNSERKLGKLGDSRATSIRNRRASRSVGVRGVTAGDVFLAWLREGIASGQIKVNFKQVDAAGAHVVKEGILLTGDLLKDFFKDDSRFSVKKVSEQLVARGLVALSDSGSKQINYFVGDPAQKQTVSGVLLTDPTIVFDNVPKVNPSVAVVQSKLSQAHLPMMQNEQRVLAKMRVPETRGIARTDSSIPPLIRG